MGGVKGRGRRVGLAMAALVLATSGCAWIGVASVADDGTPADAQNGNPSISGDGRFVAFLSYASTLVPGDTNGVSDVFRRDQVTRTTTRVNVASNGSEADSPSATPSISADGRYVAFESYATNLTAAGTDGTWSHVYVHDTVTGTTVLVTTDAVGTPANRGGSSPVISADGRSVAFASRSSDVGAGPDRNGIEGDDVYVRDLVAGTTRRVNVNTNGTQADDGSFGHAISGDGRRVAFHTRATNLAPASSGEFQVYLHDIDTGTTTRVSEDADGNEGDGSSWTGALSDDGHHVAYASAASNLGDADPNPGFDVYVHDTLAGTTEAISVGDPTAQPVEGASPSISADGRYVAFAELGDLFTLTGARIFVRDRLAGTTTQVDAAPIARPSTNLQTSADPSISADGRYVAFSSSASDLVPDDANATSDVFVRANPQPRVTGMEPGTLARGTTTPVTISGSGFVAGASLDVTQHGGGIVFSDVVVVSDSEIIASASVASDASPGARHLWVLVPGGALGAHTGGLGVGLGALEVT